MSVVTRFAPSPTGNLHLGGLRTALINYCFAKTNKGKFHLRIENTDTERSSLLYEQQILNLLKKYEIYHDGEVVYQMNQQDKYRKLVQNLLYEEKAYLAFDTKEELEQMKEAQKKEGVTHTFYDKTKGKNSIGKTNEELHKLCSENNFVVRIDSSKKRDIYIVNDMIKGNVEFKSNVIDDFIILKEGGIPTYHFANVIDDIDLGVTHVIRGEEWLSSTPKHIFLREVLGAPIPVFAHLSLLMNQDGSKMSKRATGENSSSVFVKDYDSYYPDAVKEFLISTGLSFPGRKKESDSFKWYESNLYIQNIKNKNIAINFKILEEYQKSYFKKDLDLTKENLRKTLSLSNKPYSLGEKLESMFVTMQNLYENTRNFFFIIDILEKRYNNINNLRHDFEKILTQLSEEPSALKKAEFEKRLELLNKKMLKYNIKSTQFFDWLEKNFQNKRTNSELANWTKQEFANYFDLLRILLFGEKSSPPILLFCLFRDSDFFNSVALRVSNFIKAYEQNTLQSKIEKDVFSLFFE